jgi:hypothetical protein
MFLYAELGKRKFSRNNIKLFLTPLRVRKMFLLSLSCLSSPLSVYINLPDTLQIFVKIEIGAYIKICREKSIFFKT